MIDLHCHLLPGVDDGSRSVEQSAAVLAMMISHGVTEMALTPHLLASRAGAGFPEAYERAWDELQPAVPQGMKLHRGAEVMLDRPLPAEIAERKVTIAGTRYLLVEFPRMVPSEIVGRALLDVMQHDLVPILAHPERYSSCTVDTARAWRDLGAVLQVDATTLTLPRKRGERARSLVRAGIADILAADNHGDRRSLAAGLEWLADNGGAEQATLLLDVNPRAILDDGPLYEVEPLEESSSFWRKVRRVFGGS